MNARLLEKEGFAALVLRLRAEGVGDRALLTALEATPRSLFVPPAYTDLAYGRRLLPIDCGAFMEGADLAVRLIDLLGVQPADRVLEIGTGSGFMTAVLARMCERVVSVERYKTLLTLAAQRFEHLEIRNIILRQLDGSTNVPGEGTFNRVLSTAAFTSMPRHFADHIVSGGVMIAPLQEENGETTMVRLTKIGSRFERENLFQVPYQPLSSGIASAI